jgi:type I restriction enzyme S subunit
MKLSDLIDFNPKRPLEKGALTPFIEMADLHEGERDVSGIGSRLFNGGGSKFKNGDTLFARITPCLENGKTAKVSGLPDNAICHGSTEFIVMAAKDPGIDEDFVYYVARHPEFRAYAKGRMEGTSGRQRVSWQAIADYEIPEFSSVERSGIGSVLSSMDNLISNNRRVNQALEAMARALFKAWFVDFEPVRAKLEGRWQRGQSLPGLPAHLYDLFPDRLVDSELGGIPEEWVICSFSDVVEIIGGGTPKTSVSEYWNGDIPWFSVVDTPSTSDVFVVQTEKSITRSGLEGSSARIIDKGTTIMSARGTVGNLAIAGCDLTFNQSCYALRGKNGSGSYFVFLSAQLMVEQLKAMAHGSVFSTITRQTFEAVRVVLPSENVLQQFEQIACSLFDAILDNVNESHSLAQLRDTLLPKLISGELRVPDAERIVGAAV